MGPLTAADAAVRAWLAGVAPGSPVADAWPPAGPAGASHDATDPPALALHLFEIGAEQALTGVRVPRSFRLRYLLGVADDPPRALGVLDAVLAERIAAGRAGAGASPAAGPPAAGAPASGPEGPGPRVEPAPATLLRDLGLPVRPALVVEVTARFAVAPATVPLVTVPPVIETTTLHPVRGRVVGPGGIAMGPAAVAVAGSDTWVPTAADGAFRLSAPLDDQGRARLRVTAKGREFTADVEPAGDLDHVGDEILIHCDPRET